MVESKLAEAVMQLQSVVIGLQAEMKALHEDHAKLRAYAQQIDNAAGNRLKILDEAVGITPAKPVVAAPAGGAVNGKAEVAPAAPAADAAPAAGEVN